MSYDCPVCGYDELIDPPLNFEICPCCGTEFGFHDDVKSHEQLRADWEAKGHPWFSQYTPPPAGWNPRDQLARAGFAPPQVRIDASNSAKPPRVIEVRIAGYAQGLRLCTVG